MSLPDLYLEEELIGGAPDERLFILCGCEHVAAYHVPAAQSAPRCTRYNCTCLTSREAVFQSGRLPSPQESA